LQDNTATAAGGGAIACRAVSSTAALALTHSRLHRNKALGAGVQGGALLLSRCAASLALGTNCTSNQALGGGGGCASTNGGSLSVSLAKIASKYALCCHTSSQHVSALPALLATAVCLPR
jgi:hypothetical protein